MQAINMRICFAGLTLTCLVSANHLAYAGVAGHIQFVIGNVQITEAGGKTRAAQKGDAINEGDTLTSAAKSTAQVKMQDGGLIAVRADSRLKFDQFEFNGKEDGKEKNFFSLAQGGLRAVSGMIGRTNKQNYKISTPTATIGIRGTDHETVVIPPGGGNMAPPGTYNMVNIGETAMTTNLGTVNVRPGDGMAFSPGMNQPPVVMPVNTQLFNASHEPAPQAGNRPAQNQGGQQNAGSNSNGEQAGETQRAENGTGETTAIRENAVVDNTGGTAPVAASSTPLPGSGAGGTSSALPVRDSVPVTLTESTIGTLDMTASSLTTTTGETAPLTPGIIIAPYTGSEIAVALAYNNMYPMGFYGNRSYVTAKTNVSPTSNPPVFSGFEMCEECGPSPSVSLPGASGLITGQAGGFATTGISFGRWTNAPVLQVTSPTYSFGPGSMYGIQGAWAYGAEGYLDSPIMPGSNTGPLTGTINYSLEGGSTPRDWEGNTGTLNNLGLAVDFNNQTVNASLGVTFKGINYTGSATGMPINTFGTNGQGGRFDSYTNGLTVTCAGCTSTWGNLRGAFTGQNYSGAVVSYEIGDSDNATYFNGSAALKRDSAVANSTPAPTGNYVVAQNSWIETVNTVTVDANGMLSSTGWSWTDPVTGQTYTSSRTVTCATCTGTTAPVSGIQYGTWDGAGTVSWVNRNPLAGRQFHWITGPAINPSYLPEAMIGTLTYSLDGATAPTNQNGVAGTLNSATLAVDFTRQVAAFSLGLSVNGHVWSASTRAGSEAPLEHMGKGDAKSGFYASTGNIGMGQLDVSMDGVASNSWGTVSGQLTGNGLNGAVLQYDLSAQSPTMFEQVSGVAALKTATPANTATPYRLVAYSAYDPSWMGFTSDGYYNNAARVSQDAAGNVTAFDAGKMDSYNGVGGYSNADMRAQIGTATPVNLGSDPVSGISWGRWQGGTINTTDRATGATSSITNGASSLHWLMGPQMTGPVGLPVTGTYNYVFAGGTAPTDQNGNLGTLNSASLTANFTAKTVNVGVNVTMTGNTLNASAVNVPIQPGATFGVSSFMGPVAGPTVMAGGSTPLTTSCSGPSCGPVSADIHGAFTGATGNGAGMIYGFNNGAQAISGVAAFHR